MVDVQIILHQHLWYNQQSHQQSMYHAVECHLVHAHILNVLLNVIQWSIVNASAQPRFY